MNLSVPAYDIEALIGPDLPIPGWFARENREQLGRLIIERDIRRTREHQAHECARVRLCERQRDQLRRQRFPLAVRKNKKTIIDSARDDSSRHQFIAELRRDGHSTFCVQIVLEFA